MNQAFSMKVRTKKRCIGSATKNNNVTRKRFLNMHIKQSILCLLAFQFIFSLSLHAQQDVLQGTTQDTTAADTRSKDDIINQIIDPDTVTMRQFFQNDMHQSALYQVDSLSYNFRQYDLSREQEFYGAHIGNLRSAYRDLWYKPIYDKGYHYKNDAHRIYKKSAEDLAFYLLNLPYADFQYNQGDGQQNTAFDTKFGMNMTKQFQLSIDYSKINHQGQYRNQQNNDVHLLIGGWYQSKNKFYDGFYTYQSNNLGHEHNGGVTTDTLFSRPGFELRETIPVKFSSALSLERDKAFLINNIFHLNVNPKDSIPQEKDWIFDLRQQIKIGSYDLKYFDNDVDTFQYYKSFELDERGVRHFYEHQLFETAAFLDIEQSKNDFSYLLSPGIRFQRYSINQEPLDSVHAQSTIEATLRLKYKELFNLNSSLEFGLLKATGYLLSENDISFGLSDKLHLDGFLNFYRNNQALMNQRLFISGQEMWSNNFSDKSILSFGADLEIPSLKLRAGIALHNLFNPIYYDEFVFPAVLSSNPSILQLKLSHHAKFKNFHFTNTVGFQQTAQTELSLPKFMGKHSLYYQNNIFKKNLLMQTGLDLHHNDRFNSYAYFSLIDQFYFTNQTRLVYYPIVDAFVSFKVKTFKAFVKAENLTALLTEEVPYQVPEYPQNEFQLRIGISWTMYQ